MNEKSNITPIILYDFSHKIKPKTNYFQKQKYKKALILVIILYIFLILVITVLFIKLLKFKKLNALHEKGLKQKRNLYNEYGYDDPHNYKNKEDDSIDPIAIVIVVLYFFFLVLSLYIGCKLSELSKSDEVYYNVLKYIYMANNGYLFLSLIDNVIKLSGVSAITLGVSGVICFIGTLIYLIKFCKVIFSNFFEHYFGMDMLTSWYRLPCDYIWNFISLTDPCCYSDTYTVTVYSDGTVSDNKCLVQSCNTFCFCVKRLSLIISTLVFYMFLIMLTVLWGIIKLFYQLFKNVDCNCKKSTTNPVVSDGENAPPADNVMVYGYRGNPTNQIDYNNNGNSEEVRKYTRNKSQIIPNSLSLQNSGNTLQDLNNDNRRKSLNYSMNMKQLPNNNNLMNQGNNIHIQDV